MRVHREKVLRVAAGAVLLVLVVGLPTLGTMVQSRSSSQTRSDAPGKAPSEQEYLAAVAASQKALDAARQHLQTSRSKEDFLAVAREFQAPYRRMLSVPYPERFAREGDAFMAALERCEGYGRAVEDAIVSGDRESEASSWDFLMTAYGDAWRAAQVAQGRGVTPTPTPTPVESKPRITADADRLATALETVLNGAGEIERLRKQPKKNEALIASWLNDMQSARKEAAKYRTLNTMYSPPMEATNVINEHVNNIVGGTEALVSGHDAPIVNPVDGADYKSLSDWPKLIREGYPFKVEAK